jgi:hypothetical protein
MYLRRCYRRKNSQRHADWAGVENHRTARGLRQRGDEPRQILAGLRQISLVDAVLPTRTGLTIGKRWRQPPHRAPGDCPAAARPALATSIEIAGL